MTDTDFEVSSRIINNMKNFKQFFQVLLTLRNGEFGIVHYNIVVNSFTLSNLIDVISINSKILNLTNFLVMEKVCMFLIFWQIHFWRILTIYTFKRIVTLLRHELADPAYATETLILSSLVQKV